MRFFSSSPAARFPAIIQQKLLKSVGTLISLETDLETTIGTGREITVDNNMAADLLNAIPILAETSLSTIWNHEKWGTKEDFLKWARNPKKTAAPPNVPVEIIQPFR